MDDRRIPLSHSFASFAGDGKLATEASRGSDPEFSITDIISRGYGLATFCNCDVDADVSDGPYAWFPRPGLKAESSKPQDRGTLAALAWGAHRCVDYLVQDPDIDPDRIAIVGHSRNGMVTLLAAALDERIALAIPHQAPTAGPGPSRGGKTPNPLTEEQAKFTSIKVQTQEKPQWFNARFKEFADRPDCLPFDTHCLLALVAPRPVLLSSGTEDPTITPWMAFEMARGAAPVYRLLNPGGVEVQKIPEVGRLVASKLGLFVRRGGHTMTREDWEAFLDFADAQMPKKTSALPSDGTANRIPSL